MHLTTQRARAGAVSKLSSGRNSLADDLGTTGDVDIWKISNGQWAGSVDDGPHPAGWQPLGAGDFNLDGTSDIAW
jgi:hypothetical protein